jgi:hypothetical protein
MLELLSLRTGTFLNHLYGAMDEPQPKDHRHLHLQAAQEARQRLEWQELN